MKKNRPIEDWPKRGRNEHLTASEISQLRADFNAGLKPPVAARAMRCSTRIVQKYYSMFGGNYSGYTPRKRILRAPRPKPQQSRFYKSSFDL